MGRNTAPAIALAALLEKEDDPLLLVLAADHVIADQDAFTDAVMKAVPLAEAEKLVTFGIVPLEPHTGYGYIEAGDPVAGAYFVASFKEKPDSATAAEYLGHGGYYWNSGMFMFKASRYLHELKTHRPDIAAACDEALSLDETDGVSLAFEGWRFNLRRSNTEPLVRLNIESRGGSEGLSDRVSDIADLLGGVRV